MRLIITIILTAMMSISCLSQSTNTKINIDSGVLYLRAPQYHQVMINNDISLEELIYEKKSWEILEDKLGQPNEIINDSTILSNEKILRYSGAEFMYTDIPDSLSLTSIILSSEKYSIKIGDQTIKPEMSYEKLKSVLPSNYDLVNEDKITIYVAVTNSEGNLKKNANGKILYSDIDRITLRLDKSTKTVKRIEISRRYT